VPQPTALSRMAKSSAPVKRDTSEMVTPATVNQKLSLCCVSKSSIFSTLSQLSTDFIIFGRDVAE